MTDHIDATQEDREAAAAYWKISRIGNDETQRRYLSGEADEAFIVQAFTRHRLASTAALQAERDALAARVTALEGENASLRHWAWGHIDCLLLYAAGQYPNDGHVRDAVAFCRIIKPNGSLRMDPPGGRLKGSDFHPARQALGEG